MQSDQHTLHKVWLETYNRLETLRRRVNEGRSIDEASGFARWISFSGLIPLFKANAQDGFFKVDGALIESKVELVISMCNDRYRTNNTEPTFEQAELESLHEKIDRMAGYLSRLSEAPAVAVAPRVHDLDNNESFEPARRACFLPLTVIPDCHEEITIQGLGHRNGAKGVSKHAQDVENTHSVVADAICEALAVDTAQDAETRKMDGAL